MEKDSQDSEEEEHQQKAGPQGLCGDDSEKASISEQFSIGEDRAGDSGRCSVPRVLTHKHEGPCLDPQSPSKCNMMVHIYNPSIPIAR